MATPKNGFEQNCAAHAEEVTEDSPLLQSNVSSQTQVLTSSIGDEAEGTHAKESTTGVISLLLIGTKIHAPYFLQLWINGILGVFIAHTDAWLVLATNSTIASHFSRLESASWLTTSYTMAMCASQPVVGKLSDVFGRKNVVLACYLAFAVGTIVSGIGQSMWQVIAGRAITGLGAAGMTVVVSILIVDLVPTIEIASWRSYVNVVGTTGRSLGGPLGGWLADTVGWRWSFMGQAPLAVLAFFVVLWKLNEPIAKTHETTPGPRVPSKLGRVDFIGAFLISGTIVMFLFAVDLAAQDSTMPLFLSTVAVAIVLAASFLTYEAKLAQEPIFPPLLLLQRDVATTYSINMLQSAAQLAMMFSVPLYFQIAEEASNSRAGSQLLPAVISNAFGGLLTGLYIRKFGRYKTITVAGVVTAGIAYTMLVLRWDGHISAWESLDIIPGGLGTGVVMAGSFVALTVNLKQENAAAVTSGLYLSGNVGTVLGVSASTSIQRKVLKMLLSQRLQTPKAAKV